MKKILLITILLFILVGCKAKKEDYYNLSFGDNSIVVGYDSVEVLDTIKVNSYTSYLDKKENEIVDYIEVYLRDLDNQNLYIDDYKVTSISQTCNDLGGTLVSSNGNACVLNKLVDYKYDVITLYGDILSDDIDTVDRVEVSYK